MTEREAISECKELWKEIEESGLSKEGFLYGTEVGKKWIVKRYLHNCPLCSYAHVDGRTQCAGRCPIMLQYHKGCVDAGYNEGNQSLWFEAVRRLKEDTNDKETILS